MKNVAVMLESMFTCSGHQVTDVDRHRHDTMYLSCLYLHAHIAIYTLKNSTNKLVTQIGHTRIIAE